MRPMTSLRMIKSAPPMTALVMPPLSRAAGAAQAILAFPEGLPISSTRCSVSSWAVDAAAKAGRAVAAISATTWKFHLRKASAASKRRFGCKLWSRVTNVKVVGPNRDQGRSLAQRVMAEGGCARNRASSRSSDPAPRVRERGGSSTVLARPAQGRAAPAAKRLYRSTFHLASKTALASGSRARERRGCAAPRRATCTSSSR